MGEEKGTQKRKCSACGHDVLFEVNVCPHCGNVFRKDLDEWEWKLFPRRKLPINPEDEEDGDKEPHYH